MAGSILGICLPFLTGATALGQQNPFDRFTTVEKWGGRLQITVTGSGDVVPVLDGTETFKVQKHLDYSFTLAPPLQTQPPYMTWVTCSTANSLGTIRIELDQTTSNGCQLTSITEASGPLDDVPPGPPGGPPCVAHGFQLQILPIPFAGALSDWAFFDQIPGTTTADDFCLGTHIVSTGTLQFFDAQGQSPPCPNGGCLQLPDQGLEILNTWSYDAPLPQYGSQATGHFEVVLDLKPCGADPELIVQAPDVDYASWRPMARDAEATEGNTIAFTAKLQAVGGCPTDLKVKRFTFELLQVSAEPGVCMNFPAFDLTGQKPSGRPDLAFLAKNNQSPWLPSSDPALTLVSEDGAYTGSAPAVISSFDWGGYGTLRVTADLVDGRKVVGHLVGDASITDIPVPKRQAGSKIADVWLAANGATGLPDNDDGETSPAGDGHKGDGLTLYEEYRGFYEGPNNEHREGDPKTKDLFLLDLAAAQAGIQLLQKVSGLDVHGKLVFGQLSAQRIINPNRGSADEGSIDQHGVYLTRSPSFIEVGPAGKAVGGPGLPGAVRGISLTRKFGPKFAAGMVNGQLTGITEEQHVIVHEILHACNVYHHGKGDPGALRWDVVESDGKLSYSMGGTPLKVYWEGKCGVFNPVVPDGPNDVLRRVSAAAQHGQHSGVEDCFMRYNFANVSADAVFVDTYWYHADDEPVSFLICTGRTGSDFNARDHCPQSRYGDADAGCCAHQICVNDRQNHAPGGGPTACAGGGGAGGETGAPGPGGGAAADAPPTLSWAIEEGTAPTVTRGDPLLVTVRVASPRFGESQPGDVMVIASSAGDWTRAVKVSVTVGGTAVPAWPLVPLGPVPAALSLDEKTVGLAAWWIAPDVSAGIAAGTYTVQATLDTTGAPQGWIGVAAALPVTLTVVDPPSPLPPDAQAEEALVLARYRTWQGRLDEALSILDPVIAADPGNADALRFRAEILEQKGEDRAAAGAYAAALDAVTAANPDPEEPPAQLLGQYGSLVTRILTGARDVPRFRRGDANADGAADLSDAIAILSYLFLGVDAVHCEQAGDTNDDGSLDISDAIYLLTFLFLGGQPIQPPAGSCGVDPTGHNLPCSSFPGCQ